MEAQAGLVEQQRAFVVDQARPQLDRPLGVDVGIALPLDADVEQRRALVVEPERVVALAPVVARVLEVVAADHLVAVEVGNPDAAGLIGIGDPRAAEAADDAAADDRLGDHLAGVGVVALEQAVFAGPEP